MKIKKNFLVVSYYNLNNDISWIPAYSDNYLIYDQSEKPSYPPGIDMKKIIRSKHTGHNISDNLTFIIDHYDRLPEVTVFAKGNIFPRHSTQAFFDRVMNNEYFTSIEDYSIHHPKWPVSAFSADGGYCELNKNWYLHQPNHPLKYFYRYDDFMNYCFKDPVAPRYTRFAPGANYIVPRAHILKFPKVFYENLRFFVSYDLFPGEAYIIERALHAIWNCNFQVSENMLKPFDEKIFVAKLPRKDTLAPLKRFVPPQAKLLYIKIKNALH